MDNRLEAYFATLRSSSLKETIKHRAANWQLYAAATGSALAMMTSVSAANIGSGAGTMTAAAVASVLASRRGVASSGVRLAMAGQDPGAGLFHGAANALAHTSQSQAPAISPNGITPVWSTVDIIAPAEYVSIYGTNLASETAYWDGNFPTTLGGTSVTIDGKLAYLVYVSPGQINLQVPDDTTTGRVSVVVTTANGSAAAPVTLSPFSPSFLLLDVIAGDGFVAGIIPRSDGTGEYGGGTYDILGPTGNIFGYPTVAAEPGDVVELYAVGLGPTNPEVPAGEPFSGAAPVTTPFFLYINSVPVTPLFVGLSSAGLYQINFVVPPGLGEGAVPIEAVAGGKESQPFGVFALAGNGGVTTTATSHRGTVRTGTPGPGQGTAPGTEPSPPGTSPPGTSPPGTSPGTFGTDAHSVHRPYVPRLRFPVE